MLQNNQLNKNMKKTLAVMFCVDNTNEDSNADKNIINTNDYLNKKNLVQNKNLTEQKTQMLNY